MSRPLSGSPTRLAALGAAAALTLGACGGATASGEASEGSVAAEHDLSGLSLTVGSKDYPEQRLLGAMQIAALEAAGASVSDRTGLGGTAIARTALESGEIDLYTEYTGTAWQTILGQNDVLKDGTELFERVAELDATENDVHWFPAAQVNNTFAVAAVAEVAEENGVTTLSDYARLVNDSPEIATICSSAEFTTRDDGIPGLEKTYGFDQPASSVVDQESNVSVVTMADKRQCHFSKADATDPRVPENGLIFLEDDREFFPVYNPAVTMPNDVYAENAEAFDAIFGAISEALDQDTMIELNRQVQIDGAPARKVAETFLAEHDII